MIDPNLVSKPTLFKRIFNFRNTLIILIISFTVLTSFAKAYPYFGFDLAVTKIIQQYKAVWFDQLMIITSILGNPQWAIASTLLISVAVYLFGKKKESLMIFISSFGSIIISQFFKYVVARPRPDGGTLDSFPSGHVMFYVSFYGFLVFLSFIFLKKNSLRTFLILILSLPIILGGVSRIYLGVHWFSDVLGAYLVGFVWLLLIIHLYQRLQVGQKDN